MSFNFTFCCYEKNGGASQNQLVGRLLQTPGNHASDLDQGCGGGSKKAECAQDTF